MNSPLTTTTSHRDSDTRPAPDLAVLDAVVAADQGERQHAVAKLVAVLAWAEAHRGVEGECASWDPQLAGICVGEDGLDHLGGPGTPAVAEFALEQLATRLGVGSFTAMQLVADTLDLAYRHPILWAQVQAGACPVWIGRKVAATCSTLPVEAAAWVDAASGQLTGRTAWRTIEAKIAYASAKWDPKKTQAAEDQARDGRHLEVDFPGKYPHAPVDGGIATAYLRGKLSTLDGIKFEALVTAKATELAQAGDTSSLDVRRSKALGLIADQLITGTLDLPDATQGGVQSASPARRSCLPARLFVHVHLDDLLAHLSGTTTVGTVEKLGPASLDLLTDWLDQTDLHIRPVLDLGRTDAVDAHDPPAWMRELVIQRDRHCVFPHCGHDARGCDLDHIDPYLPPDQGGPPGQTSPANLAPLCRRHHRCKTFTRWRYQRSPDGNYEWTDPDGATTTAFI